MKFLAIISIAVSISSALSSVEHAADQTCPSGYKRVGEDCLETAEKILGCPADQGRSEGDRCYADDSFCYAGNADFPAKVENRTVTECDAGFSLNHESGLCVAKSERIDHGIPTLQCINELVEKDGECREASDKIAVCSEDHSNNPLGCSPRFQRYYDHADCQQNYALQENSYGDKACVFDTTAETEFCTKDSTFDSEVNKCLSNWSVSKQVGCNRGDPVDGKCIEVPKKGANHFCPLRSDSAAVPAACYAGIMRGSRCFVYLELPPVRVCPAGFDEMDDTCVKSATPTTVADSE